MFTVDAHVHLWDPAARAYPFLDSPALAALRRPLAIDDLRRTAALTGADAAVLVQAIPDEDETLDLLARAADSGGLVAAVVGWVDLGAPDVSRRLERMVSAPGGVRLRGIRHPVQGEPDPGWLDRADVRRGIAAVGAAGLVYELLVKEPQWAAAARLARDLEVPLVLDHAGNPPIAGGDLRSWTSWLRRLVAAGPHVRVKLSGLVTLADPRRCTVEDLQPWVDTLLEVAGPDRVMAGSDWPICELASPPEQVWEAYSSLLQGLSVEERSAVLGGTAVRTYRIDA